jgi:hypothetical protein
MHPVWATARLTHDSAAHIDTHLRRADRCRGLVVSSFTKMNVIISKVHRTDYAQALTQYAKAQYALAHATARIGQ